MQPNFTKSVLLSSLLLFSFIVTSTVKAQTTLAAGDIAFTGYISSNVVDEFSFVLLKDIATNTTISFTDNGWTGTAFRSGEGTVIWTSNNNYAAGTEIKIAGSAATLAGSGNSAGTANVVTAIALTTSGDQVLAYQGSSSSPTFISAIHMNYWTTAAGDPSNTTAANWDGQASSSVSSALPTGLTTGVNAVWIYTASTEHPAEKTNARFNCSGSLTTIANIKVSIYNFSNWIGNQETTAATTGITLPTGCLYLIGNTTWNGSTWSNGAPTSSLDAIIASSTAPSSFTCKALTINSGITLNTTGITVTVNGNIANNGNGISGTGGLTIAANSTLSGSSISFNGTLTVNSSAVLTTAGLLTLSSNATNTARVAAGSSAGGYISGNVTVQRYIPAGSRKFRFLGHPFSSAMNITELTDDIDITGTITGSNANAFTATTSNSPSAFTFNESAGNAATGTTNNSGWAALTSGNAASTLAAGQGIRVLIRGTKGQANSLNGGVYTPAAVTLGMTGNLKQGDFTQSLSYTDNTKGWNLVSNPYASNVDWALVTRTNVDNAIYTYRPSLAGGSYGTYINGSAANGGSQYIEAYSSFFVKANAASPSLGWQEADKVGSNPTNSVFRTLGSINNRISLVLKSESSADTDEVILRFGDEPATDLFDSQYDALNIAGAANDLYVKDYQGTEYSIYHGSTLLSPTVEDREISLGMYNLQPGNYSINFTILNAFAEKHIAYIKDKELNTLTPITSVGYYNFTVQSSQSNYDRFSIIFNAVPVLVNMNGPFQFTITPNPSSDYVYINFTGLDETQNVQINLLAADGKLIKTLELGRVQMGREVIDVSKYSKGTYVLQLVNGNTRESRKLVVL